MSGRALPRPAHWAMALGLVGLVAVALAAMGRHWICACGRVDLWHGQALSSENSQHLVDWYTPSHVLHGLVFYAVLHLVARRQSLGRRLVAATLVEAAWEIVENTDRVIEHYRTATIALNYYGDSIVNSAADIAAMWLGFLLASRLPVWGSVALFLAAEVGTAWMIRDGLLLNVLMLLWPLDAVRVWQDGS